MLGPAAKRLQLSPLCHTVVLHGLVVHSVRSAVALQAALLRGHYLLQVPAVLQAVHGKRRWRRWRWE